MNAPLAIPEHTLLRPIGRGAYGEVWLARNVMGTLRAVKIIWRGQFESGRPFERELAGIERYEPVSRSSGGLVHVLHIGKNEAEGYFYYVMELADDASQLPGAKGAAEGYQPRTLRSDLKRQGRLPTADCLRLAIDVASGLGQLHRNGLVHRDVKPGNIIFVNQRAKLADIGLITGHGEGRTFVGTEGYIPPEGPGTPAADLYALGVVLYEASTGFPPDRFPDIPSEWVMKPTRDEALELHQIILKACEGQRQRRYADVETLQADLALLQSGQSVRRVRALERRYARLRQTGLVGTTLLVIALVVALLASYRARLAAENRAKEMVLRQKAEQAQTRAEAAEQAARQQLYAALLEQGRATLRSGELGQRVRALEAVHQAAAISNTAELRGVAVAAATLPDWRLERAVPKTAGTTLVQLDPRFERLALCRGNGPVGIHSATDQHLIASLPASSNLPAYVARWSSDGRFLIVKRDSGEHLAELEVWNIGEKRRLLLLNGVEYDAFVFHPHLPQIMAAVSQTNIVVWSLESGEELRRFKARDIPECLAISPDGERFAVSYEDETTAEVVICRLADGKVIVSHLFEDTVEAMDWHPDGRWLATADFSGAVQLLDTVSGQPLLLGRHKAQAVLAAFSPGGDYLLSAGWEREFIWWDLRRMQRAFTIALDSFRAQFRSDGNECAIISDSDVQFHAIMRPEACREFPEDLGARLRSAAFSPDNHWFAATATKRLGVWELTRRDAGATLLKGADSRLFFSDEAELLGCTDSHGYRWHLTPAPEPGSAPRVEPVPISEPPGFTSLCLASNQLILTAQKGSCALGLNQSESGLPSWAATRRGMSLGSPDGKWLVIYAPFSPVLTVYHIPTLQSIATVRTQDNIDTVRFSPQADELAICTRGGIEFWSTANWQRTRKLNFVRVLYSPDARTLWLSKDYRTCGLYNARTLEPLLPLPEGTLPLAISSDGRFLAVSVDGRRLKVWDLEKVNELLRQWGLGWQAR